MASPGVVELSRWQFAITAIFHMTFPALTVGLSVLLAVAYTVYARTGDPLYLQIFRFWKKIFAVGFGLGVVAGTVMTFEFGLNWGTYAHAVGPVIGVTIGMEVITAFFLEAGFIGLMLYGDGRIRPRTMALASWMVALGTLLSTTWILSANAHAGQGLAAVLVEQALTDVRAAGKRIVPVCPYVAKFLIRHQEFADITDPVTPEVLTWLDAQLGR
ncbi:hypothetical protein PL81_39200 [Streptomyces sp. RSD-27]|nr:hypothetical protein PL81_39200 [Streptomyces sp. RSD-27]